MIANYFYNLTNDMWHRTVFTICVIISTLFFILSVTGLMKIPVEYNFYLHKFINYYICVILIMRFNPWIHKNVCSKVLTEYDKKISFTSGILLLTTNLFNTKQLI